ncbi:hypothetical protein Ahy_B01g056722 [Arachis hypogaea]|uniref:Aspartic peptidase DDI1-type domain-containing protein n=1 Tax=Arachis hypogaea TaxID=3818 RepID=A0A445AZD7_ARAHY|nr:hypothetical protein Ahy_B01g056722 [Arachis hypogaea]
MGLGFYMRRKLLNVHIPDLAHLAEKARQSELVKKEKEKYRSEQRSKSKPFTQKEKVAYVTIESSEEELDFEAEVDLAELKNGPPFVCSLLKKLPNNEKSNEPKLKSGVQWIWNCQEFQKCDALYRHNPQWGPPRNQYPHNCGRARGYPRGINKGKEVDVDEEYFEEGDDDMIGTILIIPTEYLGEYEGDPDEDYDMENEEDFSFIRIEDESGYFLRPTEKQMSHLRPLHITTTLSGIKVNKVLIDGGVAISLLPERMLMKVGKHPDDLILTNIADTKLL